MRRLIPISILILIPSLLWLASPPVQACKENKSSTPLPDEVGVATRSCPTNTCAAPPCCTVLNATPPFTRHPSTLSGPNPTVGISCFAVARNDNDYHLLFDSEAPTFRRSESFDGGVTWSDLGLVSIPLWPIWLGSVQCPDPHFVGTGGQMTMYFTANRTAAAGGSKTVGRATSTNNGATWSIDNVQLVAPTATHYPYMPSVVAIQGGYLLAYTWVCAGTLYENATIDVLFSADGLTNWVPRAVPGLTVGSCGRWDDGSVNRPRMVVDPTNPSTIHMFYSVYDADGNGKPTRYCGRIGRAISTDSGFTWTKNTRPVFEAAPSGPSWDVSHVLKPSLVVEPCASDPTKSILRLFYEGKGTPPPQGYEQCNPPPSQTLIGLGIADAAWPFGSGACTGTEIALQDELAPEDAEPLARLTSVPNPTSSTTTIGVDLSRAHVAGEAELTIIDVTGRLVRHLWTGSSLTAPHTVDWDGRESGGARVAPGRYLARLRIGDTTAGTHWITMTR
jgi:hypothetical protein